MLDDVHAGDGPEDGQILDRLMGDALALAAVDAAVEADHLDAEVGVAGVVAHLLAGPHGDEVGVGHDERLVAAAGETGGEGHRRLLGDADFEQPFGNGGGDLGGPGRLDGIGADEHHLRVLERREPLRSDLGAGQHVAQVVIDLGHRLAQRGQPGAGRQGRAKLVLHAVELHLRAADLVAAARRDKAGL